jgi:antitoxin ParD1/3/4
MVSPLAVLETGGLVGKGGGFAPGMCCWYYRRREVDMAKLETISVELTADMAGTIREAVANGDYASESEVVEDALRVWKDERPGDEMNIEEVRRLVQEGIDSGPGVDGEEVFARLRAKYAAMIKDG